MNASVPAPVRLTGAQAIIRMLADAGVRHCYGLASGKLAPLLQAIATSPTMSYMGVRHEASAAFMASAVYAASGQVALCLGETGPGGLNLLSGLAGAAANSQAVVAITSSNTTRLTAPDLGAFSSTDNARLFAPLVKWSAAVRDARRLPDVIRQALRRATGGRPGPVHIDVSADVLAAAAAFSSDALAIDRRAIEPARPMPAGIDLDRAAALLAEARRPLLVAGGGVIAADASAALATLSQRLGAAILTTLMGTGSVPGDHPRLAGQGGILGGRSALRALSEADLVLAVGCRFSSWMWPDGLPRRDALSRLIHADIDPDVIGLIHEADVALVGDARETLEALNRRMVNHRSVVDEAWVDGLAAERRGDLSPEGLGDIDGIMHPGRLAAVIGEVVGTRGRCVFDGGHTSFWGNQFTPTGAPRTRLHEAGMTHLGFGLPWAIAIKQLFPEEPVLCLTGDGAFGFTVQELDTARRHRLPVVVVVHNNAAWGVIAAGQARAGFELGTDLSDTDYAAIARGFGCFGERVERPEDISPALERAFVADRPTVIDARVAFVPHPMLSVFGRSTAS